jgi:hypothetical protein
MALRRNDLERTDKELGKYASVAAGIGALALLMLIRNGDKLPPAAQYALLFVAVLFSAATPLSPFLLARRHADPMDKLTAASRALPAQGIQLGASFCTLVSSNGISSRELAILAFAATFSTFTALTILSGVGCTLFAEIRNMRRQSALPEPKPAPAAAAKR